jgi:tetratricopeptide (TPR) repeat protein
LYSVALHEIGHSLGVRTHSNTIGDALYPNDSYYSGSRNQLTSRDIATIEKLYTLKVGVSNPPGITLVRYSQYFNLIQQASKAYNEHNFQDAIPLLQQAYALYDREPETQFVLASSHYMLHQYGVALPLLLKLSAEPGERQGTSVQLAGMCLIKLAEVDEQVGQMAVAEEKYRTASRLLNQHVNRTPMRPEVAANVQQQIQWLNQRGMSNVIISDQESTTEEPSLKKKGWRRFLDGSTSSNQLPVMMQLPASFGFGMSRF